MGNHPLTTKPQNQTKPPIGRELRVCGEPVGTPPSLGATSGSGGISCRSPGQRSAWAWRFRPGKVREDTFFSSPTSFKTLGHARAPPTGFEPHQFQDLAQLDQFQDLRPQTAIEVLGSRIFGFAR